MNLVIVESAAKAKTIAGYLNSIKELGGGGTGGKDCAGAVAEFKVVACLGHVQDLPSKEIGVNTDTWDVTYVPIESKKDIIAKLKKLSKDAAMVYLASDRDLEGHAISFHLRNLLKLKKGKYQRVTFNEITKSALKDAFANPTDINMQAVYAQETRRVLDRVVGYQLSPLLWNHFSISTLSAGRVQSAALALVVERDALAREHEPEVYWIINGDFYYKNVKLAAKMAAAPPAPENEVARIDDAAAAVAALEELKGGAAKEWIATFKKRLVKKSPSAPFITSTLQQEVYQRYGIPAKRTMQIAQNLYELGLITYMRTDSPALSNDTHANIARFIEEAFNAKEVEHREFVARATSQEAHESIHPTDIFMKLEDLPNNDALTPNHRKIYDLIWRRTVASQMSAAIYTEISYKIATEAKSDSTTVASAFFGKVSILTTEGFLKVWSPAQMGAPEELQLWKSLVEKASVPVMPAQFNAVADATRAHSLYNEPTLVKTLEKEGIGRPSTFANIIDKLYDKKYVAAGQNPQHSIKTMNYELILRDAGGAAVPSSIKEEPCVIDIGGKETDKLVPTDLGKKVCKYLTEVIPYLLDAKFTSDMESSLDKIEKAEIAKNDVLGEFYKRFSASISAVPAAARTAAIGAPGGGNVLKAFPEISCNVVNAKYGPAIYQTTTRKYFSLKPYLEWKNKGAAELELSEAQFITSLPVKFNGSTREIHIGQYGLYVKDTATKANIKLPPNLWESVRDNSITRMAIDGLVAAPAGGAGTGGSNQKSSQRAGSAKRLGPQRATKEQA